MMPMPATIKATPPIADRPAATMFNTPSKLAMKPAPFCTVYCERVP